MLVRRLDIFHSLLVEAVHLCEQGIGHGVTPLLHEPRLVAAPGLHLLPLAISALKQRRGMSVTIIKTPLTMSTEWIWRTWGQPASSPL